MIGMAFDLSLLAMESFQVIGLRTVRLAAGGTDAFHEAQLMCSEKVDAALRNGPLFSGGSLHEVVDDYRSVVQANAKRLSES